MEQKIIFPASRIALMRKGAADSKASPKTRDMAKLAADAMERVNKVTTKA